MGRTLLRERCNAIPHPFDIDGFIVRV
ncbi:hypothetical protein MCP1_40188 [Candidatus Terasakiella magnetica]|nr:hypothetical protein MCP1_40188 [Candidatus Terasakiella magnetica]